MDRSHYSESRFCIPALVVFERRKSLRIRAGSRLRRGKFRPRLGSQFRDLLYPAVMFPVPGKRFAVKDP
jgi:hypothetical protein